MKNFLKVDDRNKRLVMDREFNKNRKIVGSKEYDLLQKAKADHPRYDVVLRHIKSNPEKQVYKNLTYAYMYEYISKHPNAEARKKELDEMILRARCHFQKYGNVKKWFLEAYPDISDFTPAQYKENQNVLNQYTDNFEILEEAKVA
jgi:hypothetical protein